MKYAIAVSVFVTMLAVPAIAQDSTPPAAVAPRPCLILKQAEGHRFRNSVIAGALTGGVGFAVGAASGGAKYEYVDAINYDNKKLKYTGKELEKVQASGVHIILVDKTRLANGANSADEITAARGACKDDTATVAAK